MSEADSPEGSGVAATGTPGQGPTPRPRPASDGRAPLPGAAVVVDLFDARRTGDRAAINEALLWHDSPDPTMARPARSLRGRDHTPLHEVGRPAPAAATRRPGYLPALDGLRAVSVAAVLAYHLGRLGGGFLGVDVFFVVSGFLITRLLLLEREDTGATDLLAFWQRRFRRLLPALVVLLVAVMFGSRWWMPTWRLSGLRADAFAALAYVANWRFIASGQSYFSSGIAPSPLRHTWSLAIEEQFYVVWPVLVALVAGRARRHQRLGVLLVAGAGTLVSGVWMALAATGDADLTRIYYGTHTRLFAILAGAWIASWWDPVVADAPRRSDRPRPISRLAVPASAGLVAAFFVGTNDETWFYRGGFQAVAVLAGLAVIALATGEGPVAWLLSAAPLRWVGRRSYGIYLWSWPVQTFASEHFRLEGLTLDAAVVGVTVALAAVSFWLVEEPIRTGRRPAGLPQPHRPARLAPRRRGVAAVRPVLALGAAVAVIAATANGAPAAPGYLTVTDDEAVSAALAPPSTLAEVAATGPTMVPATPVPGGAAAATGPFDPRAPVVVDPTAQVDAATVKGRPLRVMVAGDSVGWSLGWSLLDTLSPSVRVSDRAIIGCGLMPPDSGFVVGVTPPETYAKTCQQQRPAELIGLQEKPDVVLLWVGAWEVYDHEYQGKRYTPGTPAYASFLEERLQERIDLFKAAGVPTIMPVVPCFGEVAVRLGVERYDADRLAWVNDRLKAVAERNPSWVRMIDPQDQLCTGPDEPRDTTETGLEIRGDGAHFGSESATWFWNTWLAGQMGAAFAPAPPG